MSGSTATLPSALRAAARWERLGSAEIPALIVHPDWSATDPVPVVVWMHGRTAHKELDPGRYLRWMRAGIAACAIDLPGHGERFDEALQDTARTLDVVQQVVQDIDEVLESLHQQRVFDMERVAIGGMSAGGMAAMVRLCKPHPFRCASVEATTGSWRHASHNEMFSTKPVDLIDALNPNAHLDNWREIPFQAIHAKADEWVAIDGQAEFIASLRAHYRDPSLIDFVQYDHTGAPYEHIGFGRHSADAKDRQREFFKRFLV